MDPRRRIRQHNGEITAGAWKTKRWRPWKMVVCVWGLPCKVIALQFEFAWQHPSICRHVKEKVAHMKFCKLTRKGRQRPVLGVPQNLQVLLQMLQATPYCGMPIRVHVLDQGTWDNLQKLSVESLPKHIAVTLGTFDDLEQLCAERMLVMPMVSSTCGTCSEALRENDRVVTCPHCEHPFHVSCAAKAFTGQSGLRLMPDQPAACAKCKAATDWPVLIRTARRLSHTPILNEENDEDENEDERDDDDEDAVGDSQCTPTCEDAESQIVSEILDSDEEMEDSGRTLKGGEDGEKILRDADSSSQPAKHRRLSRATSGQSNRGETINAKRSSSSNISDENRNHNKADHVDFFVPKATSTSGDRPQPEQGQTSPGPSLRERLARRLGQASAINI
eukprot:CAMPEP_0197676898 /NCGR_PEP_ID=MMETSP1338-20131121/87559_1 /TAXON_ID=43686 ORGANISM="Pelagodinium beii, Strain RCC1491" /NCGR_SAMPLE_ID=MMETSP1338 /ASSEMBLY_ACC=CAM_ASM_000754 /LENGTH=390 /DNA_ID=CAMNT_0043257647 /DNA_START=215 /DNA_END=1387 /DNA_ORIENTATION=-